MMLSRSSVAVEAELTLRHLTILHLAVRIARFPIPVLIGIGHEIDQSVLDLVAYQSLKDPNCRC